MAEANTGIVLNIDLEIYNDSRNDIEDAIFDSIEDANKFIERISRKDDRIDFCIYNYQEEVLSYIKAEELK